MLKTFSLSDPTLLLLQDRGQLSSLHAVLMSYVTSTLAIFYQLEKLLQIPTNWPYFYNKGATLKAIRWYKMSLTLN